MFVFVWKARGSNVGFPNSYQPTLICGIICIVFKGATTTVHLRRCSNDSIDSTVSTRTVLSRTPEKNVYSCVAGVQLLENTLGHVFVRISFPELARDTEGKPISPIDFGGGYYVDVMGKSNKMPTPLFMAQMVGAAGVGGAAVVVGGPFGAAILVGVTLPSLTRIHEEFKTAEEENYLHYPALKMWNKLRTHPNFHKCNDSTLVPRQPKLRRIRLSNMGLASDGCPPPGKLFPLEEVNAMPASSVRIQGFAKQQEE
jgi:hypothetical protein